MEEHSCGFTYHAADPYPPVQAAGRNGRYAEMMLSNVGGSNSEISAVALYFYDHLITAELPEVAEVFHHVSVVEMHHLEIFGTLARQLGADPRLWSRQGGRQTWWTPGYLSYTPKLGPLLRVAMRDEEAAIQKYEQQCRLIQDPNIVANLRRILQDEHMHMEIFRCLYETYGGGERGLRSGGRSTG